MQRLKIAERQIRSFLSDLLVARGMQPNEISAAAKCREILALLSEVEYLAAKEDFG